MDLGDKFDVVIVGTGLVQSIVAAALTREGKTVLHIDENSYYGGFHATLSMADLIAELDKSEPSKVFHKASYSSKNRKCFSPSCRTNPRFSAQTIGRPFVPKCFSPSCNKAIQASYSPRRYYVDLLPEFFPARGPLIQLLISANIGRYIEFKGVATTYMYLNSTFAEVPCSKKTLLKASLTFLEKRNLVKVLEYCASLTPDAILNHEQGGDLFGPYLETTWTLSPKLCDVLLHPLAHATPTTTVREGLEAVSTYLTSLNVYCPSPYLTAMYGVGEFPQAFCRLSAVYGGVYVLGQRAVSFSEESGASVKVRLEGGNEIECQTLVGAPETLYTTSSCLPTSWHFRGVAIVDKLPSFVSSDGLTCVTFPPPTDHPLGLYSAIHAYMLSHEAAVTPPNKYVIHLSCTTQHVEGDPALFLRPYLEAMYSSSSPYLDSLSSSSSYSTSSSKTATTTTTTTATWDDVVEFSAFFAIPVYPKSSLKEHLIPCSASCTLSDAVKEAKAIFSKLMPDGTFLPAVPDPEDIVWESAEQPVDGDGLEGSLEDDNVGQEEGVNLRGGENS